MDIFQVIIGQQSSEIIYHGTTWLFTFLPTVCLHLSDDLLFLRQLILDGQWDDVIEFIQPLATLPAFNYKQFLFIIQRAKFVELMCIKCEAPLTSTDQVIITILM